MALVIGLSVALAIGSLVALVVIGSLVVLLIASLLGLALWIVSFSPKLRIYIDQRLLWMPILQIEPYDILRSNDAGDLRREPGWDYGLLAHSIYQMSKIKPSEKPKSSVYSKNGRIGLGIRTSLSFFFELRFPELALAIDLSKVSICIILFGMVALAEISLQVRVKKHGQGQRSSERAGGSRSGNAGGSIGEGGGDENGIIGHDTGEGRRSGICSGGQGQGNGDDDDNDGRRIVGNVENGRRRRNPTLEEIAAIFLPIIIQSIANIMSLNEAELSTTGRVIRYFSMIINSVG